MRDDHKPADAEGKGGQGLCSGEGGSDPDGMKARRDRRVEKGSVRFDISNDVDVLQDRPLVAMEIREG